MVSDLELMHLAFNGVKKLSLKYGESIPHLFYFSTNLTPQVFVTASAFIYPAIIKRRSE
jgi:hypothetical protein